jgi:hypothetical protein
VKIVYNACHGGFGLSDAAVRRYADLRGIPLYPEGGGFGGPVYYTVPPGRRTTPLALSAWHDASPEDRGANNAAVSAERLDHHDIPRTDAALVQTVEELGDAASGRFAELRIAEVPAGTRYRISEYDGLEAVMTVDSYEWEVA